MEKAMSQAQTPRSSAAATLKASGGLSRGSAGAVPALDFWIQPGRQPSAPASARAAAPRASVSAGPSLSLSARGAASLQQSEDVRRRLGRERQKKQELQDKFQLLQDLRSRDEKLIEERRQRLVQAREHRLDAALQALCSDNMLGPQAATVLLDHEARDELKQQALYNKWDAEVARRVEYHVGKFMNHVALPPPPGLDRCELRPGDDPLKRSLRDMREEEKFHRYASAFLDQTSEETPESREALARLAAARGTDRPMRPVEQWGRSVNNTLRVAEDGSLRTTRKMGGDAHRAPLDESDGVPVAGKTRTKFQKSLLGTLEGDARLGEAARYKTPQGASSGAPCQDHYGYAADVQAANAEFPMGKRVFPAGPPDMQRCMAAGAMSQNLLP